MRTEITRTQFGQLFQNFEREAFRLETLDQYLVPSEQREFERFLAGEPLSENQNKDWAAIVEKSVQAGKQMSRVHLVTVPLSSYLRFEVNWGYVFSAAAGERVYLLDRQLLRDQALSSFEDFWIFDSKTLVMMRYDREGHYIGADLEDDPQALSACLTVCDRLLREAAPLREFLARQRNT